MLPAEIREIGQGIRHGLFAHAADPVRQTSLKQVQPAMGLQL
jgi:hypothetical protein